MFNIQCKYLGIRMSIYRVLTFPVVATWANTAVAAGHALRWAMWGSLFDVDIRRLGLVVEEGSFLSSREFMFVLLIASTIGAFIDFESFLALSDILVGLSSTTGEMLDVTVYGSCYLA